MTVELALREPVRLHTLMSLGVARAMLRRESQSRSLGDRLRALYQDSELEKRRAAGLQLNMALNMGAQSGPVFNGSFASILPGAYQVVQSDLGLTYGGTLLAAGTSPPVITLTGALVGTPVPILVSETFPGILGTWTGSVSYDGGATVAQTFTSAATVPLTGKGAGLTLNIAAGASATGNTWTATCAGLKDQSGNARHYVQLTAAKQPVITVGLNGKVGLLFDGVDDSLDCSTLSTPAPATTNWSMDFVFRQNAWSGSTPFDSYSGQAHALFGSPSSPSLRMWNAQFGPSSSGATIGSWTRGDVLWTGSTSDRIKLGSVSATGPSAGNNTTSGRKIGGRGDNGSFFNLELLMLAYVPGVAPNLDLQINSARGYGAGNVAV